MKKAFITLLTIFVSNSIFAENIDSIIVKKPLEEVTIVGFKQNDKQPVSVSKLGLSFIQKNEINSMTDLSAIVPNLFMPDYGSRQGTPIYLRGIGSRTGMPAVALYVDGVPYFERSSLNFDLVGISNIEVLRGPQGTLYGRNAIGGVINVYRYSPLDYQRTIIRTGYGSQSDIINSISHTSKLSDNVGLSVSGLYHSNDGFFFNQARKEYADRMTNGSANVGLEWKISDRWRAKLSSSYDYLDQNGYPYGALDANTNQIGDISYDGPAYYKRQMSTNGLNFLYKGNRISFNSQTSYQFLKDDQMLDQDFSTAKVYAVGNKSKQNLVSQEFTFKGDHRLTDWLSYNWVTGAFGLYQKLGGDLLINLYPRKQETTRLSDQSTISMAVYHQSSFKLFDRLTATLGIRYDFESAKWSSDEVVSTAGAPKNDRYEGDLKFYQLSPKFALQYDFNNVGFVYASLAKGFKPGGFNRSLDENKRTFAPEYSWNYELGCQLNPWNDLFNVDLSLFYIDWQNQQIAQIVPGIGNVITNAGKSNSKGSEVMLSSKPVKDLFLQVNYGYTYAKFTDYVADAAKNIDFAGNYIPFVPKHTISANATYTLRNVFGPVFDKVVFNLGVNANGPFYWKEDNKVEQKMYTLLNGKIAFTKEYFTFELWSKNMTNAKYFAYCFNIPGRGDYAQQGKPCSFGASVVIDF